MLSAIAKQRRIVHPDSDKLGKPMVGGDSKAALRGERYVSIAKGSLGESIRGKVPVLSESGEIIGLGFGWLFSAIN